MKHSLVLLFYLLLLQTIAGQNKYFVDKQDGNDANNGLSWNTAFENLQTALAAIFDNDTVYYDTIWVAAGTYYTDEGGPTVDNNRNHSFFLSLGVQIYGGFVGNETNLSQRDFKVNQTILSGDLQQNDGPDFTNYEDNAYHVIQCKNQFFVPRLDGFTVEGGNADTLFNINFFGAGIYNLNADPKYFNCIVKDNYAKETGAGMQNSNADVEVHACQFLNNRSESSGGGVYNHISSTIFSECHFEGNFSGISGGGMNNTESTASLEKCMFINNIAETPSPTSTSSGGGIYNTRSGVLLMNVGFKGNNADRGGGLHSFDSVTIIYNGLFQGNRASTGGALYWSAGNHTLINGSISGNRALFHGGGLYNIGTDPDIINTVIWNNKDTTGVGTAGANLFNASGSIPTISSSLIQNVTDNTNNNIDGIITGHLINYPEFIVPVDPLSAPSIAGNLRVHGFSPLIDSGDGSAVFVSEDLDCIDRSNSTVDLGAYENPHVNCPQGLTLDQNYSPLVGTYEAIYAIEVMGEVDVLNNATVILNAMSVELKPNVNINLGATVEIQNDGCTN